MKQQKIIPLVMAAMIVASFISLGFLVGAQGGGFHAVKGAVYFRNNSPAPAGVSIFLEFPDENLSRTTFPWDNGFNYVFSFQGHDGQTGMFSLYYEGMYHIPVANSTVLILKDVIGYYIDLHFDIEPSENQPPYIPSNPNPSDGEADVFINTHLSWTGGDPNSGDVVTYDVYFGTTNPPIKKQSGHPTTSFNPGLLNRSTTYFWKIAARDNHDMTTAGPVWSFTTVPPGVNNPPNQPSNPSPAHGATGVPLSPTLFWSGGDPDEGDSVTYDIYLGKSPTVIKVASNHSSTSFTAGALDALSKYSWMIVAWDAQGLSQAGALWEFTTQATPPQGGGGVTNIPPVADLSAGEPYRGIIGETLTFDGSRSYDPDGTIVSWQWTFGDGSTGAGNITTHMYTSVGSFDVTLRVTDNNGAQSTASTNAIITAPNLPPTDVLLQGPTKGQMNVTYTFVLSATDPEAGDLLYSVDWDDETFPSEGQLPHGTDALLNHTWMTAGVYQIEAWVQDDQNARTYVSHRILINVEYAGDFGYLIDHDNDGVYDTFYSNTTMSETAVELQDDGTYYLDVDGDGLWDYIYDPVTKQLTQFPTPDGEQDFSAYLLLGGIIAVIVILLALLLLIPKK